MAVQLTEDAEILNLRIYINSIGRGEYRDLRLAALAAERNGQVTWLADGAGNVTAAIVPAEFLARVLQVVSLA
jgi:hypothetical protein